MKSVFDPRPFVLLDDSRAVPDDMAARLYVAPSEIVTCRDYDDIPAAFARLESALDRGRHLAGWFSYELGYAFEPRLRPLAPPPGASPLLWVGVFDAPLLLTGSEMAARLDLARHPADLRAEVSELCPAVAETDYLAAIGAIKDYLLAGDIYQANYTFPLRFRLDGSPLALYRKLRFAQPVSYAAWVHMEDIDIISASPELFLERRGESLTARPMKGTAPRGRVTAEDEDRAAALQADEKSRAENVMIVDLLRNDLSRIADSGSVEVPRLFEIERYRTLLQMTSTVTARRAAPLTLLELFRSLFPCGSVTGAPKIRAMEIIRALEPAPRGVYTGAIGYVTPDRDLCFNVPIRTLTLARDGAATRWRGRMGVGGGIIADSEPAAEYEECLLKGRFLTSPQPDFDLLETLYWSPAEGYRYHGRHLDRLTASARHFDFRLDRSEIEDRLQAFTADLPAAAHRVRLLAARTGGITITAAPFDPAPPPDPLVRLAPTRVRSGDPLLYHKTTARGLYASALAEARAQGPCFDCLMVNERGELTEGSFTNLFIKRGGILLTPPLSSGLLPGILRAELLASGRVREAVLTPQDLAAADRIFLGNALRGLVEVTFRSSFRAGERV